MAGDRYNSGKPEMSMVLEARHALTGAARVLEMGKKKYARGNWRKGLSLTQTSDCLVRHLTAWLAGEDNDAESGLPHLDHVLVNALFLSELLRTHPELDDRSIEGRNLETSPDASNSEASNVPKGTLSKPPLETKPEQGGSIGSPSRPSWLERIDKLRDRYELPSLIDGIWQNESKL